MALDVLVGERTQHTCEYDTGVPSSTLNIRYDSCCAGKGGHDLYGWQLAYDKRHSSCHAAAVMCIII